MTLEGADLKQQLPKLTTLECASPVPWARGREKEVSEGNWRWIEEVCRVAEVELRGEPLLGGLSKGRALIIRNAMTRLNFLLDT